MDVVDQIRAGDRMLKVTVESASPQAEGAQQAASKARVHR
jgi:hypothetical protein